jgi:hypothetical protein
MALISSLATILGVLIFTYLTAGLGHRILRLLGLQFPAASESLLCSVGLGVITMEIGLFLAEVLGAVAGVVSEGKDTMGCPIFGVS